MDHHDEARSTADQRQTRAEYELIEHPDASRSLFTSDRRGSFPVHIVRGVCDSVFRLAHGRTIGAYIECAIRPYAGGIWPAMAQAPPRRRTFTYRLLVSGLFGSCHHGRFLPGRHVGRRTIRDAIVGSAARNRRSGGCHHCGVVLVCADGHHRVRAHPLGSSHATEPSCAERSMSDAAKLEQPDGRLECRFVPMRTHALQQFGSSSLGRRSEVPLCQVRCQTKTLRVCPVAVRLGLRQGNRDVRFVSASR